MVVEDFSTDGTPSDPTSPLLLSQCVPDKPKLRPCLFGSHARNLKGEDGLRVDRLMIGPDLVTAVLVVDGHGGHKAAALAIDELLALFAEYARGDASSANIEVAAEQSFRALHEQMTDAGFDSTSGTAVTLCIVNETRAELTCCSVGDAFAILVAPGPSTTVSSGKPATTELTVNTRLDDSEEERERVRSLGGKIGKAASPDGLPCGPLRAWPGGITCASSLGDADCANLISPVPRNVRLSLPDASAIIVASDGLWDAMSFMKASKVALSCSDPTHAAETLVNKALRARGLRDDITAVVVVCGSAAQGATPLSSSEPSSENSGDHLPEGAAALRRRAPSPKPPSRFRISSMLRPPKAADGTSREVSVKGGRLFESLAHMAAAGDSDRFVLPQQTLDGSTHSLCDSRASVASSSESGSPMPHRSTSDSLLCPPSPCSPASPDFSGGGHIPLFAFLNSVPELVLSPSGSRENLSVLPGSCMGGSEANAAGASRTMLSVPL